MRAEVAVTVAACLFAGAALAAFSADAETPVKAKAIAGQTFSGEVTVQATASEVWSAITDVEELANLMGFVRLGGGARLAEVGDHASLRHGGDAGVLFVSYVKPDRELRLTWEPENGSYICRDLWILIPTEKGTAVRYEVRYTESGKQSEDAIRQQEADYQRALTALKEILERKDRKAS
jgi:uncharacterized protein YndB with AHSA1/START domain